MTFGLGLVIGKFLPPHRGHAALVEAALEQSERVVVIVCAKPTDLVPGELRGAWMRELHPQAEVLVIDDRYDENDSRVWAENTMRWLGRAPDAVFTSEDYGDRYSALMGARHVCVDRERRRFPVSGTAVRADPYAAWEFLGPPVRGWFAKRVAVVGAESTGTTTLAHALAEELRTEWVAECGREYSARKQLAGDEAWRTDEFVHIAEEQTRREDAAARRANRLLVCDTNAFATALWHRRYMGSRSEEVDALARHSRCDLYLLTGDEIPFVQDGLRDGEHVRHAMHAWFVAELAAQPVRWLLLRGSHERRLEESLAAIDALFASSAWKPRPDAR